MSYKERLIEENTHLANLSTTRFVGYGLKRSRANGTLINASISQIVETPVAENLVVGMAIGLALGGLRPIAFIERMDFIFNAMDAIVNHMDKIERLSKGEFSPSVIIRTVVGSRYKPLYTGLPHTQDLSDSLRLMLEMPVYCLEHEQDIDNAYNIAVHRQNEGKSTILVEYKDLM